MKHVLLIIAKSSKWGRALLHRRWNLFVCILSRNGVAAQVARILYPPQRFPGVFQGGGVGIDSKREQWIDWRLGEEKGERAPCSRSLSLWKPWRKRGTNQYSQPFAKQAAALLFLIVAAMCLATISSFLGMLHAATVCATFLAIKSNIARQVLGEILLRQSESNLFILSRIIAATWIAMILSFRGVLHTAAVHTTVGIVAKQAGR